MVGEISESPFKASKTHHKSFTINKPLIFVMEKSIPDFKPFLCSVLFALAFIACKESPKEVTVENPVQVKYLIDRWKTSSAFYTILPDKQLIKRYLGSNQQEHGTWKLDANILFFEFDNNAKERYEIRATLKNSFFSTYPGNYTDLLPQEFIRAKIEDN